MAFLTIIDTRTPDCRISPVKVLVLLWIILGIASMGYFPAAHANSSESTSQRQLQPGLIVENNWLRRHYQDENVVVVDVRAPLQYEREHIEGAVNIPVARTFSGPPSNGLVAPISTIRALFSNAGIDNNTTVVIYDNGNYFDAARVFWVLEVYGHRYAGLLNGGLAFWKKKGMPVSNKPPEVTVKQFVPTIVPENLSTKFSTRLAINDQSKVIIDARSSEEYRGKRSITRRYGHIPSAINIPSSNNYTKVNGVSKIKSVPQLKTLYSDIDDDKEVIAYCNKGKESALTYFVLRRLGYRVSAYDGSWYEWSNDPALPVVSPESIRPSR